MIKFDKARDKVAIIAPASGVKDTHGNMDKALSFARLQDTINFFEHNGFECSYDDQIFSGNKLEYLASARSERIRQLKVALEDPSVKIIHAFRGGYGCLDMAFNCLDIKPAGPKILIGFSDITTLHLLFNQRFKFPSIHGVMSSQNPEMLSKVISVIGGKDIRIELQALTITAKAAIITGEMMGGNLTVLCSAIGTKLHPDTADKILFLEDVNEKDYQIHRHLVHMYEAGLFAQIKALVLGEFIEQNSDIDLTIAAFINDYLPHLPVYKTNSIGHGQINFPVIIGGVGAIEDNSLTISSPFKYI